MTDPIKEQAEKEARDIVGKCDLFDQNMEWMIAKTIEKHLRDKTSLESQLAEAKNKAEALDRSQKRIIEMCIKGTVNKSHLSVAEMNVSFVNEALAEAKAEVERLKKLKLMEQSSHNENIKWWENQLTQERQLADELAQSCIKCANPEEHWEIVLKHKKRRGEA